MSQPKPAAPKKSAPKKSAAAIAALVIAGSGAFIAGHEGTVLRSYADPAWGWKVPTACSGETGPHIRPGMTFTMEQCLSMLDKRIAKEWAAVQPCIKAPISVNEGVAIVSWSYNVGSGAACSSTLMRRLNAGEPPAAWCAELKRWTRANGKVLPGLVKRRDAEYAVCMGKDLS